MTTFADLVPQDGRGIWWGLEVSFDDFATISYRWGTASGLVEGEFFERRILSGQQEMMPDFTRGLGIDHLPAASTWTCELDNLDAGVDWLADLTQWASQTVRARYRLKLGLYNPADGIVFTQTLGYFVSQNPPSRTLAKLTLTLADDHLGQLAELLTPPTTNDWLAVSSDSDNPLFAMSNITMAVDFNQPWPLMFGAGTVRGQPITATGTTRTGVNGATTTNAFDGNVNHWGLDDLSHLGLIDTGTFQLFDGFGAIVSPSTYVWNPAGYFDFTGHAGPSGGALTVSYVYGSSTWSTGIRPIMVCATRALAGAGTDSLRLTATFKKALDNYISFAATQLEIPAQYTTTAGTKQIWADEQSVTITKSGVTWKLLWLSFDVVNYQEWFYTQFASAAAGGNSPAYNYPYVGTPTVDGAWQAFDSFDVLALGDLSAVTGAGNFSQNPVDVLQDLVEYYSPMYNFAGGPIDTARFDRARAARQGFNVKGMIAVPFASSISTSAVMPGTSSKLVYESGLLAKALGEICGSADIDLFLTYSGQVGCAVQVSDFTQQTTDYPSIDETKVKQDSIQDYVPGANQRWAPYNAAFIRSPDGSGQELGPFRNEQAISDWGGQVLERHLEGVWWQQLLQLMAQGGVNFSDTQNLVWAARGLESRARPMITFETDFTFFALGVDLCDDFKFTWTRGGNAPVYEDSLFRLEGLVVHPDQAYVTVIAVWMGDFAELEPYLLDDETLVVRKNSSGGRTATVADSSSTVTFSSGSLITDGVAANDHLILKDSTETATGFTRNRALKIASITDATHLVVSDPDLNFGGGAAVASWEIRRSYRTYPTAGSDPTHYPNGSAMYGKVSDGAGEFSDSSAANELLDG